MSEFQVHYRVSELLKLLGYVLNKRRVQTLDISMIVLLQLFKHFSKFILQIKVCFAKIRHVLSLHDYIS